MHALCETYKPHTSQALVQKLFAPLTYLSGLPGTCNRKRHLLAHWIWSSLMQISLCSAKHQSCATVVFRFYKHSQMPAMFIKCYFTLLLWFWPPIHEIICIYVFHKIIIIHHTFQKQTSYYSLKINEV